MTVMLMPPPAREDRPAPLDCAQPTKLRLLIYVGSATRVLAPRELAELSRPRYQRVIDDPAICAASGASFIAGDKRGWCERVITPLTNGGEKPTVVFGMTVWPIPEFSVGPVEREETEAEFFTVGGSGA